MTWNELPTSLGKLTFNDVKISAAHAAGANAQKNLIGRWNRLGKLRNLQWMPQEILGRIQDSSFHSNILRTLSAFSKVRVLFAIRLSLMAVVTHRCRGLSFICVLND
jgi:hypothetical protein